LNTFRITFGETGSESGLVEQSARKKEREERQGKEHKRRQLHAIEEMRLKTHWHRNPATIPKHLPLHIPNRLLLCVNMIPMVNNLPVVHRLEIIWRREKRAEKEVLHDGQATEDFGGKHFEHARVYFWPGLDGRDVVEHGGVPTKGGGLDLWDGERRRGRQEKRKKVKSRQVRRGSCTGSEPLEQQEKRCKTNRIDEADTSKVHIVVAKLVEDIRVVDRFGTEVFMVWFDPVHEEVPSARIYRVDQQGEAASRSVDKRAEGWKRTFQLTGAEEKRQEVVVVEAPDAMRAGGLEPVRFLEVAHDGDVSEGWKRSGKHRRMREVKQMLQDGKKRRGEGSEEARETTWVWDNGTVA
jgi:hypothetical protein